jgi:hypothetical protein
MSDVVFSCHSCGATVPLEFGEIISRRQECARCGADLHCCRNCRFFDPARNNECAEPQSDRVVDKAASNFCDYFEVRTKVDLAGRRAGGESSKKRFDDLFK